MFTRERPSLQRLLHLLRRICELTLHHKHCKYNFVLCFDSMGLAGVRNSDNVQFFDAKKPLVVVYYDVDYERNPKGKGVLVY